MHSHAALLYYLVQTDFEKYLCWTICVDNLSWENGITAHEGGLMPAHRREAVHLCWVARMWVVEIRI